MPDLKITYERSETLDLFLALQRELMGRFAWEISFLPRPVVPQIARFRDGLRAWRDGGLNDLPGWVAASDASELTHRDTDDRFRRGTQHVVDALAAAGPVLRGALASFDPLRAEGSGAVDRLLRLEQIEAPLRVALGVGQVSLSLPVYLVPLAPYPPAAGFLAERGNLVSAYADCRRFVGSTLADCVLALLGWALLRTFPGPDNLSTQLADRLPGGGPYHRRLRVVLTKILVEMTAGHFVRAAEPGHRPCVDVLGTAWRFPRLYSVADRHWGRYLAGLTDRPAALSAIAAEVSRWSPRWYVDQVDAAPLAADFYLLEWLASAGDADARRRLAHWLPQLARDFAGQLDLIIGTELGHYERAGNDPVPAGLASFLRRVTAGDSRVAWPRTRVALGHAPALALAVEAFAGPGAEYGGEAWAPIAATLRRYVCQDLPPKVFVDQCFTLEHNNGSLFDKYWDADNIRPVLDAQAAGELATLAAHASPEVRDRWHRHRHRMEAGYDPVWLGGPTEPAVDEDPTDDRGWSGLTVRDALPGGLGCGSALDRDAFRAGRRSDLVDPVRVRRPVFKRPLPETLNRYAGATATLHTTFGQVHLQMWPLLAPYTVDNFVLLALGRRRWKDPATGEDRAERFYDGTQFHRRIPDFLVQGGDRTGTGLGGPGYRIPDEIRPEMAFDRPYIVAMANTGRDSTGSQFFITLAPAKHLTGSYTQFGAVTEPSSQGVLAAIAAAPDPVTLHSVDVNTW